MSLFGALQSGISGLAAQSTAMGAISDNIVNVNTVGYKNNTTSFQTLVTKQTSSSYYSPGGVQPVSKQGVNVQGLLSSNSSSTALAVSGNGYFVVMTEDQARLLFAVPQRYIMELDPVRKMELFLHFRSIVPRTVDPIIHKTHLLTSRYQKCSVCLTNIL